MFAQEGWEMQHGRAATRVQRRAFAVALALAVVTAAVAPVAPGRGGVAAQGSTGTIVHSTDGVLLRAEPTFGAEGLTTLVEGETVALRTASADTVSDPDGATQWWPIATDDTEGWVAGFYLDIDGLTTAPAAPVADLAGGRGGEEGAASAEDRLFSTWDLANAVAKVAEPEGINLRQDPSASSPALKALSYETILDLRIYELDTVYTEGSRWWPVQVDGLIGGVSGAYLAPAESWSEPQVVADTAVVEALGKVADWFEVGSYVMAATDDSSGVNIRADAAPDAERIGIVPESDVVQVMDGPIYDPIGNPWYLITDSEVTGFVSGWYLNRANQPGEDLATTEIPSKVAVPGLATGTLAYPVDAWVFTQAFGCSPYAFEPWNSSIGCNFHNGADFAADAYTPLLAADGGTVEYAGWCDCGLGYYVKIDHGNGMKTTYGHMAEQPWVTTGEAVTKGQVIGPMGSTGLSTGPHTHLIVNVNGVDQDPLAYLP
jgi:murein DD-endopeptidase MepM/ murein hydrolase activator NlpD